MSDDASAADGLRATAAAARFRRWFGIHFLAAFAVFLAGAVAGAALMSVVGVESLQEFATDESMFPEFTFAGILVNNLIALGVDALGLVTVGLASALMLFLNGLVVGAVVAVGLEQASPLLLAALVVPHGVIELSAFFLVGGMAFRVYHRLARYLIGYDDAPLTRVELFEVAVLLAVAVAMIVVAAAVEVFVTPGVAELVTGREIPVGG